MWDHVSTKQGKNKASQEIKHLQSTTVRQNAISGGMRLRAIWHPWVEILNRKWTLENRHWVWIEQTRLFSYVTVFVPCDSLEATCKLSALPLQRWLTMKEHWAHGTHAQHSGDYCDTARQTGTGLGPDRPECWPTDDASDDLRTCVTGQETTDGVHATREKTPQNCLTPPSEVKNRQFYARKKKKKD